MKFDFVIGNPPYQQETSEEITTNGQKSRKNIFHHFQIAADDISRVGSILVFPGGRWIHQSGKGLKQFGLDLINDRRLSRLVFYPRSRDIFTNTDIPDGISIVVMRQDKTADGFNYDYCEKGNVTSIHMDNPGTDLMPLNPQDKVILLKIDDFVKNYHLSYLHDAILPRSLFSVESDFVQKNPDKVREYSEGMYFDPSKEVKLFTNDKAGAAGRSRWFLVDRKTITQNPDLISEFQVVVSSAHPGGQDGRDNQLSIIDDKSVFGRARVALRSFKTLDEAQNFYRYLKTHFARYALLMTDEALSSLAKRVPDFVQYKNGGLLDYSKDLDEQLFALAQFNSSEIDYIHNVVENSGTKEMT